MCGICGIRHLDGRPAARSDVAAMNDTMVHRGPDGEGVWVDGPVGLGHRRLSIIDLATGDQPMSTPDGALTVVFNGEIYNFLELKGILEGKGHRFRTTSDTESILYAYREWGLDFVRHLRGMFAIGLWDERRSTLILARDRIGKKPLYYLCDGRRILFGSELKALAALPDVPLEMDPDALCAYLSFGYVPSPMSIFRDIRKLPPAHLAVCTPRGLELRRYWRLPSGEAETRMDETEAVEQLSSLFDEAVRLRLISDVPLGAFLSGGLDSSAVVASMARQNEGAPVRTTSIGFSEEAFDELPFSRVVAGRFGADHTEFTVRPDALSILEELAWHFDEPFADASAVPTYYVSKMARQKVKVALSGDGGDETFAGYVRRYAMNRLEDRVRRRLPSWVRSSGLGPLAGIYPRADLLPRPFRLKAFLTNLALPAEQAYFRDMSFLFGPEEKAGLLRPEVARAMNPAAAFSVLGRHFDENRDEDVVSRVQYVDAMTYLPEDILVKVDRMSMAHSLEVRSPILDHRVMEFAARLPSRFKLNGHGGKAIFKKMNADRLPEEIRNRRKQGFCVPLGSWFREDLKGYARDVLLGPGSGLGEIFRPEAVRRIWEAHQGGREDNAVPLWGLLMLELWRRRFSAGERSGGGARRAMEEESACIRRL